MKSLEAQKFIEYYKQKKVTGTYDAQREGTSYRRRKRKIELQYFLELIDKKENEKVLELGCSSGFLTEHLGKVTAIDTSEDMLTITRKKNPLAECIHADMFELPFKNNSFDKVVTMRVWNHLDRNDLIKAIKEVKRVLKNKGYLIFDAEDKSWLRRFIGIIYKFIFRPTGYKIYQYSMRELYNILKNEGFIIEKVKFIQHRIGRQIILKNKLIENRILLIA